MQHSHRAHQGIRSNGFTLVEILIVVVILGILAAVVIPQFTSASQDSKVVAFTSSVKTFAEAATVYQNITGQHLEDSGTGALPAGWEPYVNETEWTSETPIGGQWDFEYNSYGFTSCFGVHFFNVTNPGDAFMTLIDESFDDGDLGTGTFQKIDGDRYYYILAK